MSEHRPRVTCPKCGRDVALTAKRKVIGPHKGTGKAAGWWCEAAGTMTESDVRAFEMRQLAALVAKYPDQAYKLALNAHLAAKEDGT